MPRVFKNYSRQHQKLLYAGIIKSYANWLQSKEPVSVPNDYWTYKAKEELKRLYVKATRELSEKEPLEAFKSNLTDTLDIILPKNLSIDQKKEIIWADIDYNLRKFIEELSIQLGNQETFSLALRLLSQEKAIAFTQFCIDYFMDHEIPMDEKLIDMIKESEHDHYIYALIKKRKCCICGKENADLHHEENVNRVGGYQHDTGLQLRYLSLCRQHHTEAHAVGIGAFRSKYHLKGIKFTDDQVKYLKKVYKNHFKAYEEE